MNLIMRKCGFILLPVILITTILLMSTVPPVSRDALTHHLAVPKLYIEEGQIHELPHIMASYYPQLLDLFYCIPMLWENDIVPKYIHFSFALLTSLLIYLYLRKQLNSGYGLIGALFFLSLPVIVKLSVTVYVDLGLIFFSTASLLSLFKWQEKKFVFRWLFCSALLCGLAMSTKYNGLVTFFILVLFVPIIYLNNPELIAGKFCKNDTLRNIREGKLSQLKAMAYGLCFALTALTVFSPWMIKNYIWTQNPIYPLYDNVFNPVEHQDPAGESSGINHFIVRKLVHKETGLQTAFIPLRIFFQGQDDNPKFFDGRLNPLLFFLPLVAVLLFKTESSLSSHRKYLLLFAVLYILIVFFRQDMRIRWIGPAIPPLVILSVYGLYSIVENRIVLQLSRYIKHTILFLIVLMAGLNFVYIFSLYKTIDPMPFIKGKITRSEYIEKFRPEYASIDYTNKNFQKETKILALFLGDRRYYSNHDFRSDNLFFKQLIKESETSSEIVRNLKKENYTTFILNYPKTNSWIDHSFTKNEKIKLDDFLKKYTRQVFSKNGYGVIQILGT